MEKNIYFYKGNEELLFKSNKESDSSEFTKITEEFNKVFDNKNLSFLLGAGCSSYVVNDETISFLNKIDEESSSYKRTKNSFDCGIPTMAILAEEFYEIALNENEKKWLKEIIKIDIESEFYKYNIENLLSTLHSLKYYLENSEQNNTRRFKITTSIIKTTRNFLLKRCLNETTKNLNLDSPLLGLYKTFYRKLLYRNPNLPKLNIFTTNYDLYSEMAMDKLGIHYVNGFSGGIKKYFNPTIFNYALAEKMDLSHTKWSVIDNFIYLYKLHGSVNWVQEDEENKLFRVRELQETTYKELEKRDVIMIHPTPLKQSISMSSPYSDLFREFQKKIMQNNNILITIGYSFSDEHINNLIFQAFTIPSFRLIIFGDKEKNEKIKKLLNLNDPRIWIIGGDIDNKTKLHYFNGVVNYVLPNLSNEEIDDKIENAIKILFKKDE
jgi:hypothetical protein